MKVEKNGQILWKGFYGPNLGYLAEQFEQYKHYADKVSPEFREVFERWGDPFLFESALSEKKDESLPAADNDKVNIEKVLKAASILESIRSKGHLVAEIFPLEKEANNDSLWLLEKFGISEGNLRAVPIDLIWKNAHKEYKTAWDAVSHLKDIYTGSLACEFDHISSDEEKMWLRSRMEERFSHRLLTKEEKISLLKRLTEVEEFEQFLHKTFVGQKRFSIEGVDMLVPMLQELIREGVQSDVGNIVIGMAHRGRLSVLAHVMEKPYSHIFAEFLHSAIKHQGEPEGCSADGGGWTGDVKYHLGYNRLVKGARSRQTRVTLANNPSHLEFVSPVVEGFARAAQEDREKTGYPVQDTSKAFAILIHGDAAFPGQGIVSETLNLEGLKGYQTGGTIHLIANNMVGFTTDSHDSRSTRYASDPAKGFGIPIIHVNADDPEACLAAVRLAYEYRARFKKDFLIDLVGYRRFGHNEMDDPAVTQPHVYKKIAAHPTVRASYADQLKAKGVLGEQEAEQIALDIRQALRAEYNKVSSEEKHQAIEAGIPEAIAAGIPSIDTGVPFNILAELNGELLRWPEGFNLYPKLKRILERRKDALSENGKVEWALAEALAFASILKEGTPIRLSGQDSERGTFAQRHIVLHDTETNETYSPLHRLSQARASFAVHNSPLSEAAVVGFEYGYNVFAPETLVMWEAQYGDFANTAQALFDQFVSAGRAKWGQKSGLVILLPHGYEGQGPEHSSARPERFLQLAAENNWTVANLTSAAQYFHVLRRQAASLGTDFVRPLVIMAPKSLLRHPLTASTGREMSEGRFQMILEQPGLGRETDKVRRLVLATGKMAIDLAAEIESSKGQNLDEIHIVRIEQLYPFPKEGVEAILKRYPNVQEIVWVQEEPKNMGGWHYIAPLLFELASGRLKVGYIGRPDRSSPSGGDPAVHKKEQERIIHKALKIAELRTAEEPEKILVRN